jgi:hypothetical protein
MEDNVYAPYGVNLDGNGDTETDGINEEEDDEEVDDDEGEDEDMEDKEDENDEDDGKQHWTIAQ